jgi:hypothetical protein
MHEQTNPRPPAEDDAIVDGAILDMLLHDEPQGVWSVEEVARALDDALAAADAIARLHAAGLVHRLGDFVFATRAAVRCAALGL